MVASSHHTAIVASASDRAEAWLTRSQITFQFKLVFLRAEATHLGYEVHRN